jgi:3-hydroxyacyl-[acyl-carrier-protein] dehydratase
MTMRQSIAAALVAGPREEAEGRRVFRFRFDAADPVFAGHFPGQPLLPGVFQLEIARRAAEWELGVPLRIREISRAKFQRPFLPDEVVKLELRVAEAADCITARAHFSIAGRPAGETILSLCRSQT